MKNITIIINILIIFTACITIAKNTYSEDLTTTVLAANTAAIIHSPQLIKPLTPFITANNKKISLDFENIPVKNLLQILANFTQQNIVISGSIDNTISLHLHNISWYQALNIILQTQGLAKQQIGNTLLIAPLSEITEQQTEKFKADQLLIDAAPLQSILIPIQYSKAYEIAELLKNQNHSLLSARGNATADMRTNTIWLQDVPEKLLIIQNFVHRLDVPVKQISIEARIVNVDTQYEQELGVRFGTTQIHNNLTTKLNGTTDVATAAQSTAINNSFNKLNVDLPATNTGITGGASSIGLALAKLGNGTLLDLELSALESEGGGEIISKPHLMTNNDQAAIILSGEEIPYQETTASGATSVTFKKAVLSLSVTPQINPNGKIGLTLKVNQDRPSNTLIHGVPAINTHEIETHVIVNNSETIVLGGIYEQTQRNQVERVPFLGKLPVVGILFRHTLVHQERKELLIFITPTVIDNSASQ